MLPQFMSSSYQAYKKDTAILLQWLSQTAEQCGFTSQTPIQSIKELPKPSQRLKGKDRKKAKEAAAKHGLSHENAAELGETARPLERRKASIKEFLSQAKAIVNSQHPHVIVPASIIKAGLRAVTARRKCATWFREHFAISGAGNTEHWFFIELLEEVISILSTNCSIPPLAIGKDSSHPTPATSTRKAQNTLANLFSILDLDEPEDSPDKDAEKTLAKDKSPQVMKPVLEYEVEDEKDFEEENALFAAFCLYEDLHRFRDHLKTIWASYMSNDIDLATASIITNTTFDLARRAEEDFRLVFPALRDVGGINQLLQDVLTSWARAAFVKAMSILEGSGNANFSGNNDDVLFARNMSNLTAPPIRNLVQNINDESMDEAETAEQSAEFLAAWMFATPYQVLLSFRPVLKQGMIPTIKRGFFGDYDPLADRSAMSNDDNTQEDRIILFEILPEFCFLKRFRDSIPALDELTRELMDFVDTKEISVSLTFFCQVFLDIHHLMRDQIPRGLRDLQELGTRVHKQLTDFQAFVRKCKDVPTWAKHNAEWLDQFVSWMKSMVLHDVLIQVKKKHGNWSEAASSVENWYFLSRHPLICGIFSAHIIMNANEFGSALADGWGTVFIAHFYNAMRQQTESPTSKSWVDMDLMIAFNTEEHLFLGEAPKTMDSCFKKFCLMMGISATSFTNRRRAQVNIASKRGARGLKHASPLVKLLKGPYVERQPLDYTTRNIEELLNVQADIANAAAESSKALRRLDRSSRLSPLAFLQTLRQALERELPALLFDHVLLFMHGQTLLSDLKSRLRNEFRTLIGGAYSESEIHLPFLCVFVVQIAANFMMGSGNTRAQWPTCRAKVLKEASEALDDVSRKVGASVHARTVQYFTDKTSDKLTEAGKRYIADYASIINRESPTSRDLEGGSTTM